MLRLPQGGNDALPQRVIKAQVIGNEWNSVSANISAPEVELW